MDEGIMYIAWKYISKKSCEICNRVLTHGNEEVQGWIVCYGLERGIEHMRLTRQETQGK
jgi:hypothetical protein